MNIVDIPSWAKSVYGFTKEDLKSGVRRVNKHVQSSSLEVKVWRERNNPKEQGGWQFMPVVLGGVQLWEPVIRLVARKTVVETPLVERDGSVKEIISMDDYIINIRGIIKNNTGLWPDEEIGMLAELYRRNEAIPIISALTSHFLNGNEYAVITNLNIPETPGYVESVRYEIECVSDIPFELELE